MIARHFSLFLWGYLRAFTRQRKPIPTGNKIYKERVIIIIPITKDEAQRLNKEYKIQFHRDDGISSTYSKPKKFYLTPVKRNIDALNEIRGVKTCKNIPNFRNKRVGV